jgi:hypothetical protein
MQEAGPEARTVSSHSARLQTWEVPPAHGHAFAPGSCQGACHRRLASFCCRSSFRCYFAYRCHSVYGCASGQHGGTGSLYSRHVGTAQASSSSATAAGSASVDHHRVCALSLSDLGSHVTHCGGQGCGELDFASAGSIFSGDYEDYARNVPFARTTGHWPCPRPVHGQC